MSNELELGKNRTTAMPSDDALDLLTAYALDALEPEEVAQVGELLDREPELRSLLSELRATADALPYGLPQATLPPDLRQRVLDHAVGRTSAPVHATAAVSSAATPARRGWGIRGWLAGVGTLAGSGLVVAALALGQLGSLRSELARTRAALQQQIALNQQVATVAAASPETVALRGDVGSATVLRDSSGQIVLAANLPPIASGRVYQLWIIGGNGTPLSAGTFTVGDDRSGLVVLPTVGLPAGDTFAITNEPGPNGSSGPTTPILLSNSVSS